MTPAVSPSSSPSSPSWVDVPVAASDIDEPLELLRRFLVIADPDAASLLPPPTTPTSTTATATELDLPIAQWNVLHTTSSPCPIVVRAHPSPGKSLYSVQSDLPGISVKQFWNLMGVSANRPQWDNTCQETTEVGPWLPAAKSASWKRKLIRGLGKIEYLAFAGIMMIAKPRDMIILTASARLPSRTSPLSPSQASPPSSPPHSRDPSSKLSFRRRARRRRSASQPNVDVQIDPEDSETLQPPYRLVSTSQSISHPNYPVRKGYNRFDLGLGGFMIEEIWVEESRGKSKNKGKAPVRGVRVTQISDLGDVASWVPATVVRMVAQTLVPRSIGSIAKASARLPLPDGDESLWIPGLMVGQGFLGATTSRSPPMTPVPACQALKPGSPVTSSSPLHAPRLDDMDEPVIGGGTTNMRSSPNSPSQVRSSRSTVAASGLQSHIEDKATSYRSDQVDSVKSPMEEAVRRLEHILLEHQGTNSSSEEVAGEAVQRTGVTDTDGQLRVQEASAILPSSVGSTNDTAITSSTSMSPSPPQLSSPLTPISSPRKRPPSSLRQLNSQSDVFSLSDSLTSRSPREDFERTIRRMSQAFLDMERDRQQRLDGRHAASSSPNAKLAFDDAVDDGDKHDMGIASLVADALHGDTCSPFSSPAASPLGLPIAIPSASPNRSRSGFPASFRDGCSGISPSPESPAQAQQSPVRHASYPASPKDSEGLRRASAVLLSHSDQVALLLAPAARESSVCSPAWGSSFNSPGTEDEYGVEAEDRCPGTPSSTSAAEAANVSSSSSTATTTKPPENLARSRLPSSLSLSRSNSTRTSKSSAISVSTSTTSVSSLLEIGIGPAATVAAAKRPFPLAPAMTVATVDGKTSRDGIARSLQHEGERSESKARLVKVASSLALGKGVERWRVKGKVGRSVRRAYGNTARADASAPGGSKVDVDGKAQARGEMGSRPFVSDPSSSNSWSVAPYHLIVGLVSLVWASGTDTDGGVEVDEMEGEYGVEGESEDEGEGEGEGGRGNGARAREASRL